MRGWHAAHSRAIIEMKRPRDLEISMDLLVNLDILYGRSKRERFALGAVDVHVVDDQAVGLTEERTFGGVQVMLVSVTF